MTNTEQKLNSFEIILLSSELAHSISELETLDVKEKSTILALRKAVDEDCGKIWVLSSAD